MEKTSLVVSSWQHELQKFQKNRARKSPRLPANKQFIINIHIIYFRLKGFDGLPTLP